MKYTIKGPISFGKKGTEKNAVDLVKDLIKKKFGFKSVEKVEEKVQPKKNVTKKKVIKNKLSKK